MQNTRLLFSNALPTIKLRRIKMFTAGFRELFILKPNFDPVIKPRTLILEKNK